MPDTIDPAMPGSGQGQPENKAAVTPGLTPEQLQAAVAPMITGAVKRHLMEAFKSEEFIGALGNAMTEKVKAYEEERHRKPPTDMEALKSQVETLTKTLNATEQARVKAEQGARRQQLETGIASLVNGLDGRDGKHAVQASARESLSKLIRDGHCLPAAPELDESGAVVVKNPLDGQVTPLASILANGYLDKNPWAIERFMTRGSGPQGVTSPLTVASAPAPGGKPWKEVFGTPQGDAALAEMLASANGDPVQIAAIYKGVERQVRRG